MYSSTTSLQSTRLLLLVNIIALLLCTHTSALTPLVQSGCAAGTVSSLCVNVGSGTPTVGKYQSDTDLVKYRKNPSFVARPDVVLGADEPVAYNTLVEKKTIKLYVEVPANSLYDVTIGIVEYQKCDAAGNQIALTIGGVKQTVNPIVEGIACNTAATYTISGARSNGKGRLPFKLKGKSIVSLATICVTKQLMTPSTTCTGNDQCETFEGCGDYTVIHASAAVPGTPCEVNSASDTPLNIEEDDVYIRKAVLQWAGSGYPNGGDTNVTLNGQSITSTLLYKNYDFEPYYGAIANSMDVTDIVRQFGYKNQDYSVANIFHRKWHSCPQAHIAAWSLTVMYEKIGLPDSRINICAENTKSNRKIFDFSVGCIVPWPTIPTGGQAKATFVAIETDTFTERVAINGIVAGFNLFKETSGEGFDVIDLDVARYIKDWNNLTLSFSNITAHDKMTVAVMNTYQTL